MKRVLFLCTGNYYRSRYAQIVFNARRGRLRWVAESAGLRVDHEQKWNLGPLSPDAVAALRRLGLPLNDPQASRMPRAVSEQELAAADRVIALKRSEHEPMMRDRFPDWAARIGYWSVDDVPPSAAYDPMAAVERDVEALIAEMTRETGDRP